MTVERGGEWEKKKSKLKEKWQTVVRGKKKKGGDRRGLR